MTKLSFCQNEPLMRESFWQKISLVTNILFELGLFWYVAHSQILGNTLYKYVCKRKWSEVHIRFVENLFCTSLEINPLKQKEWSASFCMFQWQKNIQKRNEKLFFFWRRRNILKCIRKNIWKSYFWANVLLKVQVIWYSCNKITMTWIQMAFSQIMI